MSPVRSMVGVVLLAALVLAAPMARAAGESPVETRFRQGLHYHRMGQLSQARAALEEAAALPGGDKHFGTQLQLARLYYDLLLLAPAFAAADKSVELAWSRSEQKDALKLRSMLRATFGRVDVALEHPRAEGEPATQRLTLERTSPLISPRKKEIVTTLVRRLAEEGVELPATLYLPFGDYRIEGVDVTAAAGTVGQVVLANAPPPPPEETNPLWWAGGAALLVAGATTAVILLLASGEEDSPRRVVLDGVSFEPLTAAPAAEGGRP